MTEEWVDIEGFEGDYSINKSGIVISRKNRTTKELKPCTAGRYNGVFLCKNGKITRYNIHYLVAKAFPNICGEWYKGCVIDHINGNSRDNRAENLRVCTQYENIHNPISENKRIKAVIKSTGNPVIIKKNGKIIRSFNSAMQAAKYLGVCDGTVRNIIRGKSNYNCGYELYWG